MCCDGFNFSNGDSEDWNYAAVPVQLSMMTKMCYEVNKLYKIDKEFDRMITINSLK